MQEEQGYRGNRMQEVQEEQGRKQGIRRTDPRSPGNRGRFVRRDKPAQGRRENGGQALLVSPGVAIAADPQEPSPRIGRNEI